VIYKLGNIADVESLTLTDEVVRKNLLEFTSVLTYEYGADRDIDHDDGGYVLYVTPGSNADEILTYFDYKKNTVEWVNCFGSICCAMYLLNNEYAVVIVMSIADAPSQIVKAMEEETGNPGK
jgi:hypothetical protein